MFLRSNKITKIDRRAFWTSESNNASKHGDLRELYLDKNRIKRISGGTFDPLIGLQTLSLARNRLGAPLATTFVLNLPQLTRFRLDYNRLRSLPEEAWLPPQLREFSFQNNRIAKLSGSVFKGATSLMKVTFSPNLCAEVRPDTFAHLYSLRQIVATPIKKCTCKYAWVAHLADNIEVNQVCKPIDSVTVLMYLKSKCQPMHGYPLCTYYVIH